MYFDQMGKQHVSRRRKPSPVRKAHHTRRSPSSFDDSTFSQHIWPRPDRAGTIARAKKAVGSAFTAKTARQTKKQAGFNISLTSLKKLIVAAGVVVVGFVGTNWDSISEKITPQLVAVTPQSLEDPMEARWDFSWRTSPFPVVEEAEAVSFDEIPLNVTERFIKTEYQVKHGDSISGIAAQFSLLQGSIIAINKLRNAWDIKAGTVLWIPNMDGIPYTVQKNDSISRIAARMKVPQNAILDANDIDDARILPGQELFIPGARMSAGDLSSALRPRTGERPMIRPVAGRITSGFGWREDPVRPKAGEMRFHQAVDLAGRMGDPIKAAMRGTVQHIDHNPNLGNFLIMRHDGGFQTLYAHLSGYSVSVGETVEQGHEIGKVGDTGYTTGPHLHFEVFRNGNRVNPLDLVR